MALSGAGSIDTATPPPDHSSRTENLSIEYKATRPHQFWFIDGRMMDFETQGVRWWSLIIVEGYSRTMLAGAVAPSETSWAALTVLYTSCLHYGAPECLISDKDGAYTSNDFEAVCKRLDIAHKTIRRWRFFL
jgi:transposase InsO family protein